MSRRTTRRQAALIHVIVKQEDGDTTQPDLKKVSVKEEDSSECWEDPAQVTSTFCDKNSPTKTSKHPERCDGRNLRNSGKTTDKKTGKGRMKYPELSVEERRAKRREKEAARIREKRAKMTKAERARDRAKMSEEQRAKARARNAARNRERRAQMTEEERAEERRKVAEHKRRKRMQMSEEQLAQKRREDAAKERERYAKMSEEQLVELKSRKRTWQREAVMRAKVPGSLSLYDLRRKEKAGELTPDEKSKLEAYREENRKGYRRRAARMTEEQKEALRTKNKFARILREVKETPEIKAAKRERNRIYQRNYLKDPEKKRRWLETLAKNPKRYRNGVYIYEQERKLNLTPEERQKQLLGYRISRAKSLLKKKLEESGESQEEIQIRLEALVTEMRAAPLPPPKPYRPVPQRRAKSGPRHGTTHVEQESVAGPSPAWPGVPCHMEQDDFCEVGSWADDTSPGFCEEVDDEADETCDYEAVEDSEKLEFTCEVCPSGFAGKEDLRTHMILIHSESCWRCPKCSEVMLSPLEFSEHFKTHQTPQQCSSIPREMDNQEVSGSETVYNFSFNCFRCDEKFMQRSELSQHVKVHHPASFWPCEHCDLLKYSERSLRFHLGMCTKREKFRSRLDS